MKLFRLDVDAIILYISRCIYDFNAYFAHESAYRFGRGRYWIRTTKCPVEKTGHAGELKTYLSFSFWYFQQMAYLGGFAYGVGKEAAKKMAAQKWQNGIDWVSKWSKMQTGFLWFYFKEMVFKSFYRRQ